MNLVACLNFRNAVDVLLQVRVPHCDAVLECRSNDRYGYTKRSETLEPVISDVHHRQNNILTLYSISHTTNNVKKPHPTDRKDCNGRAFLS